MDLSERLYVEEQMDDFSITDDRLTEALEQLPKLNRMLGTYRVAKTWLRSAIPSSGGTNTGTEGPDNTNDPPVSILDVGSGIGDIPIMLAKWCAKTGRDVRFVATDANSFTSDYARESAIHSTDTNVLRRVTFETADALSLPYPDNSFDFVIASQLLHHFAHEDAVRCVSEMDRVASYGILINDLHRHAVAYHSIGLIVKLLGMTPMIQNDGPISVRRGFVRAELEAIAKESHLGATTIRWHLPFRWSLSTLRT